MLKFGNDILKVDTSWIDAVDYNPLNLPSHTIRLLYEDGITPYFIWGTAVQVSESPNIWDLTYESNNWRLLLNDNHVKLIKVLGANTTGVTGMGNLFGGCEMLKSVVIFDTSSVTDMRQMFDGCKSLKSIPKFDTSNVTDMNGMFGLCNSMVTIPKLDTSKVTNMGIMFSGSQSLTTIPLLDTSSVTGMNEMFMDCTNVQTGALDLYQQASTQDVPPTSYTACFRNCGSDTTTGAAELAQIPSDWK